jgi:hypothetical protein
MGSIVNFALKQRLTMLARRSKPVISSQYLANPGNPIR